MVVGTATVAGTFGASLAGSATGLFGAIYGGPAAGAAIIGGTAALGVLTAGLGLIVVGVEETNNGLTWDCWKAILHDSSTAPSDGKTLNSIIDSPLVTNLECHEDHIEVRNVWGEYFRLDPVLVPTGMALHATMM